MRLILTNQVGIIHWQLSGLVLYTFAAASVYLGLKQEMNFMVNGDLLKHTSSKLSQKVPDGKPNTFGIHSSRIPASCIKPSSQKCIRGRPPVLYLRFWRCLWKAAFYLVIYQIYVETVEKLNTRYGPRYNKNIIRFELFVFVFF